MTKRNKELSAAFTALFSGEGKAEDCMSTDVVVHGGSMGEFRGLDALKGFISAYRTAFPDVRSVVEDQIAEGDKVVTRWTSRGTHEGDLNGIAPTGKAMETSGVTIERIAGDRIVEVWVAKDDLGMLQQLGVVS
jgi:predicted ester cyclase